MLGPTTHKVELPEWNLDVRLQCLAIGGMGTNRLPGSGCIIECVDARYGESPAPDSTRTFLP